MEKPDHSVKKAFMYNSANFNKLRKKFSCAIKTGINKEITYLNNLTILTHKELSGHHQSGYI